MANQTNTCNDPKSRQEEAQKAYHKAGQEVQSKVKSGIRQKNQISIQPDIQRDFPLTCRYFQKRAWIPFPHQIDVWHAFSEGRSGLLNAPTGTGKTSAVWLPVLERIQKETHKSPNRNNKGIRVLWLTPLRALARDTEQALIGMNRELDIDLRVVRRTGDTSSSVRTSIDRNPPDCLVTTPESLHVLLSRPDHLRLFRQLDVVIVDEWHELMGSKRGVMTELGLSRLRVLNPGLITWGMSATIGNLEEALQVLAGNQGKCQNGDTGSIVPDRQEPVLVQSEMVKSIRMQTILPDNPLRFPWAGHMGLKLLPKVIPIIRNSRTTLLFTNTRSQTEVWYQKILETCPDLAGQMAIHHGSIDASMREWVEEAVRNEQLKLVISTSSLDLGVDFSPVETVIQVGSPKGVARYLQRAGRSGHQPGAESRIHFVPTHGMELIEAAALHTAAGQRDIEARPLFDKPVDVLLQFLTTLAAGGGFHPNETRKMIRATYTYRNLTDTEWEWALGFLTSGGTALRSYPDYRKLVLDEGMLVMPDTKLVRKHRLSIGTIVDDPVLKVQYLKGGFIGTVEESFISRMRHGDTFLFAGKWLTFVRMKDMAVYVRRASRKKGVVSRWMGGRMELSSRLARQMRDQIEQIADNRDGSPEAAAIRPIMEIQQKRSHLPGKNEFLIEYLKSREGHHLFFYPVEGRAVHEGLASLAAWRISRDRPVTFSLAMNDFGFELLTDQDLSLDPGRLKQLFHPDRLESDLMEAINASEMSRRHFRELARISGLLFSGYPGRFKGNRHIQASSEMLYEVFRKYDPENRLLHQAAKEVLNRHISLERIKIAANRIMDMDLVLQPLEKPSPFCVPILVDRLRAGLTSEELEDRIRKMQQQLLE